MRAQLPIILLLCFVAACASHPRAPTKADCGLEEGGVYVSMYGISWNRLFVADSEPVTLGTHVGLSYVLNLDPDPAANQRRFDGLADHARLQVSLAGRGAVYRERSNNLQIEVRGEGLVLTRALDRNAHVSFEGTDLDAMLGGEGDIDILALDGQREVLRRERLSRGDLRQIDALMRRLSGELLGRLSDPPRFCAPEEEIIVT